MHTYAWFESNAANHHKSPADTNYDSEEQCTDTNSAAGATCTAGKPDILRLTRCGHLTAVKVHARDWAVRHDMTKALYLTV